MARVIPSIQSPTMWALLLMSALLGGCYNQVDLSRPIIWEADDRRPISEPEEETEGQWFIWDGTHKMIFYRVEQLFNLGRSLRTVGTWVGLADPVEAGNVNALDEVPHSTWFTNRHVVSPLSQEELRRGPTTARAPDPDGEWTVISAKESLGSTPGFVIRDNKQDVYLIKFDSPLNPEMTTASEMITPRFLHAAGYNVPEHYLVTFDPDKFVIDPTAKIRGKYRIKRPMTTEDVNAILDRHGLLQKNRRRRRWDHPGAVALRTERPNQVWPADFKGHFQTQDGQYCYPLTVKDHYRR